MYACVCACVCAGACVHFVCVCVCGHLEGVYQVLHQQQSSGVDQQVVQVVPDLVCSPPAALWRYTHVPFQQGPAQRRGEEGGRHQGVIAIVVAMVCDVIVSGCDVIFSQ